MQASDAQELERIHWGFALSGGGAYGAYTAGVMYGLREVGILSESLENVKVLIGVSTGALVAAGVADGDFEALRKVYTEVNTADVIRATHPLAARLWGLKGQLALSAAFGPQYLYDTNPMRTLVKEHVGSAGFQRMIDRKDEFDVSFVSVDLATGEVRALGNQTPKVTPPLLEDAVMASTNQPVLMNLVEIQEHLHCDGGLRDFLPANQLMRSPFAKELDVFVTVPLDTGKGPSKRSNPEKIFDVLTRTVELLSYEVGDSDQLSTELVDAILLLRREVDAATWDRLTARFSPRVRDLLGELHAPSTTLQFLTIRPSRMPVKNALVFEPEELKETFELGKTEGVTAVEQWLDGMGRTYVAERRELRDSPES